VPSTNLNTSDRHVLSVVAALVIAIDDDAAEGRLAASPPNDAVIG